MTATADELVLDRLRDGVASPADLHAVAPTWRESINRLRRGGFIIRAVGGTPLYRLCGRAKPINPGDTPPMFQ